MIINIRNIPDISFAILKENQFIPVIESMSVKLSILVVNEPTTQIYNLIHIHFGDFEDIEVVYIAQNEMDRYLYDIKNSFEIKKFVHKIKNEISTNTQNTSLPAVQQLIEHLLNNAISSNASDIHIDITDKHTIVKERIDSFLKEVAYLDKDVFNPLSSAIKLLANIDIAKRKYAHDGRFSMLIDNHNYDFRVSTVPTIYGESIVIRILDTQKETIGLNSLGMSSSNLEQFKKSILLPYGLVLVTGPTGSGKTTTLYASIEQIVDPSFKIMTLEDPVEYRMDGIQQIQLDEKIGFDYKSALKSVLRQDPDKLMIGEIRDKDTLQIAIQSALTGHLVFSTLHTNDSISAVTRMMDMGLESYLISGTVKCITAQRLVRKLCEVCKEEDKSLKELEDISAYINSDDILYKAKGCSHCLYTGYKGRDMISEVLVVNDELSSAISSKASKEEMLHLAKINGFISIFEDGIEKVVSGVTTLDEVYRVSS